MNKKRIEILNSGWCLVLSGGGTKGVYHIGVWKALKELGIKVEAFTGASIGAIIAAFLSQGLEDELDSFVQTVSLDSILALPPELSEEGSLKFNTATLAATPGLFRSFIERKGLDTSPMRNYLESKLDEAAIRASGKDLGIVTVNRSDLKSKEIFIDEMEEGKLVDYVMASAAFPGFQSPVIEGKRYMDGGIYDNIPYAMARKRGYRRLIVSDISGAGRNRRPDLEGSLTVYIKNSLEIGGIFDFNRDFLEDFSLLGYLDTMRTFGRFDGRYFFVEPDPKAEAGFAEITRGSAPRGIAAYRPPLFPDTMAYDRKLLLGYLECAALILEVSRLRTYTYVELADAVARRTDFEERSLAEHLGRGKESLPAIAATLMKAVAERKFEHCPYFYWRLAEELLPKRTGKVVKKALSGMFHALPAGITYLETFARPGAA
ncbi:MAG: patatin-like phospholipase family protein [Spirochaetes bacterium]|nr:patatin-like phospholipase family protein [Spirochaetota bacterium]